MAKIGQFAKAIAFANDQLGSKITKAKKVGKTIVPPY